jgi:hypothetical protein
VEGGSGYVELGWESFAFNIRMGCKRYVKLRTLQGLDTPLQRFASVLADSNSTAIEGRRRREANTCMYIDLRNLMQFQLVAANLKVTVGKMVAHKRVTCLRQRPLATGNLAANTLSSPFSKLTTSTNPNIRVFV